MSEGGSGTFEYTRHALYLKCILPYFTVTPIYITIIMRNTHLICNNRTMKIQSKSCPHIWGGLKAMFW